MKPLPAPHVPGNTEAERMSNAVRKMFSMPKEAVVKAESKWQRAQTFKKKRAAKKPS